MDLAEYLKLTSLNSIEPSFMVVMGFEGLVRADSYERTSFIRFIDSQDIVIIT